MKHITLILITIALLTCTNHKAQNTNSEPQDTIQSQQSTDFCQQISVNNEKTDKNSLLILSPKAQRPSVPHSSFLISKEILLGKFNPATDSNFVLIPDHMASNKSMYCHHETFDAYLAMRDSALCEGITLTIVSATRNFDRQLQIWNRKWQNTQCPKNCPPELGGRAQRAEGVYNTDSIQLACDICKVRSIMRYSSMPGTSRHHWGTDLDFISVEPEDWTHGEGLRIYNWLCANAHKFGFFQPYTADPARTGYAEERWHWSYAPLSKPYLETYKQKITAEDITGFSGSYLVDSLNIIESHVLGITQ